jgi:hypothetical protein
MFPHSIRFGHQKRLCKSALSYKPSQVLQMFVIRAISYTSVSWPL